MMAFLALFTESRGFSKIWMSLYFTYNVWILELRGYDSPK
jgi:hypothetical protein